MRRLLPGLYYHNYNIILYLANGETRNGFLDRTRSPLLNISVTPG